MSSVKLDTKDLPLEAKTLRVGQRVLLSGTVYTARDAAHKRIYEAIESGAELPFPLEGTTIYYTGPTPAPDGMPIGSCGPTTSGRMDKFTPLLMDKGLVATIGKGERSAEVVEAIKKHGGVYLCALGGAGALASKSVLSCEVIAYHDLGTESIKHIELKDFPLIVATDCLGNTLFA